MFDWFEAGNNGEQYMAEERLGGGGVELHWKKKKRGV